MRSIIIDATYRVGTRDISSSGTYEGEGLLDLSTDLPAGTDAEVLVKTDANTATFTLPGDHELTDGDFDVYWGASSIRYGVPGTIANNVLSLDGGAGDDFPVTKTPVVVAKQVEIVAALTGNLAVAMVGHCKRRAHLDFRSSVGASLLALNLMANKAWGWADDLGFTNPLAGVVVAKILASCGDSAGTGDLSVPLLYDAVS